MNENKIVKKIKKGATIKLILSLPLLAAAVLLIYFMGVSGLLSFEGYLQPCDMNNSLKTIDDIAHKPLAIDTYYVSLTVNSSNIIDTGIQNTKDGKPVSSYLAVPVDEKYVFCLVSVKDYTQMTWNGSYTFKGSLDYVNSKVVSMAVDDMIKQGFTDSEARDAIYGYYIDTTESGVAGRTFLFVAALLLLVGGLLLAARSVLELLDVKHYPQVKRLAKTGDVDSQLEEIEQQYALAEDETQNLGRGKGAVCLTDKWILVLGTLGVKFMRAEDLLWAYKLKQTTKSYGFTTNVAYFLKLRSAGKTLSAVGREQNVDSILGLIFEKYPHVVVGYSTALESVFKSNKEQFASYAESSRTAQQ